MHPTHAPPAFGVLLLIALLSSLVAAPVAAAPLRAFLDDTQSDVAGTPLSGTIDLELADGPPSSPRAFDVVDVAISGGGLSIGIDESLANPGLGVLMSDGGFLIPALFLVVDDSSAPFPLTIIDLVGTFGPSAACAGSPACLETDFQIDTGGLEGILDVRITATVPEPATALLLTMALVMAGCTARSADRAHYSPQRSRR